MRDMIWSILTIRPLIPTDDEASTTRTGQQSPS
jgi:hypothetical protein